LELQLPHRIAPIRARSHKGLAALAYPVSIQALMAVGLQVHEGPGDNLVDLLVPRAPLDRLADIFGAPRIHSLTLAHGVAVDDPVMRDLSACLQLVMDHHESSDPDLRDEVALTILLYIAQHYAQTQPQTKGRRGGLSAWQMRIARKRLCEHFEGFISLEAVAAECGLSLSHFTREFRRATGLTPYRWLRRQRIELAKEMILSNDFPLTEVAQACGFIDQSHLTRTFSAIIGLPPARWRNAQAQSRIAMDTH